MSTRYDDEPPTAAIWWDKFVNFAWRTDWTQVVLILGLSALGVVAIWSAGEFRQSGFWRSQIVFIAIGWVAYWVVASVDYRQFLRHARRIYLAGVLLLLPVSACAFLKVDLGGFIRSINGARRWMDFGPFSIQPSEFAKVAALVFIAALLARGMGPAGAATCGAALHARAAVRAGMGAVSGGLKAGRSSARRTGWPLAMLWLAARPTKMAAAPPRSSDARR